MDKLSQSLKDLFKDAETLDLIWNFSLGFIIGVLIVLLL